jgi:RimJ/RimL family protein N-acetyltransferase
VTTPTLRGSLVQLEPLEEPMAEELAAAIAPGDDVFRWTSAAPRSVPELRAWIRARQTPKPGLRNFAFAQRDLRSGRLGGSTSLFDVDAALESAEIGHTWLVEPCRRSGMNTEAKLLLLAHAFESLGLQRVQITTYLRNERSQRAIERLGATREGVLRNFRRNQEGGLRTSVVYSVIASEWPERKARLRGLLEGRAPAIGPS